MSLEHSQVDIDAQIEKLRTNLRLYNDLQRKLMLQKYGSKEEVNAHIEEWQYMYSPEFEESFKEVMKELLLEDPTSIDHIAEKENETLEKIQQRIDILHTLEHKLIAHSEVSVSETALEWHKQFGKDLMHILHTQPELLTRYIQSQDSLPEKEMEVLREIEDSLYTKEK